MSKQFQCSPADSLPRRSLLIGAGISMGGWVALKLLLPDGGVQIPSGFRTFSDLLDAEGQVSADLRNSDGTQVVVRGYLSPAMRDDVAFDLYERSPAPCMACGLMHDPGRSIAVRGAGGIAHSSPATLVMVSGLLRIDAQGQASIEV
jgi:hypothetical protein